METKWSDVLPKRIVFIFFVFEIANKHFVRILNLTKTIELNIGDFIGTYSKNFFKSRRKWRDNDNFRCKFTGK